MSGVHCEILVITLVLGIVVYGVSERVVFVVDAEYGFKYLSKRHSFACSSVYFYKLLFVFSLPRIRVFMVQYLKLSILRLFPSKWSGDTRVFFKLA